MSIYAHLWTIELIEKWTRTIFLWALVSQGNQQKSSECFTVLIDHRLIRNILMIVLSIIFTLDDIFSSFTHFYRFNSRSTLYSFAERERNGPMWNIEKPLWKNKNIRWTVSFWWKKIENVLLIELKTNKNRINSCECVLPWNKELIKTLRGFHFL